MESNKQQRNRYKLHSVVNYVPIPHKKLNLSMKQEAINCMETLHKGESFLVEGITKSGNTRLTTVKEWIHSFYRRYCRKKNIPYRDYNRCKNASGYEFVTKSVEEKIDGETVKGVRIWRV